METKHPVSATVTAVEFALLAPEDVRALSVRQITSPESFDALGHAVEGGLYDAALGPTERGGRCATCGLGVFGCPGHFGHVELAVPVYAPLTFNQMFAVLRQACLYCHRFRAGAVRTAVVDARLRLLDAGCLLAARTLEDDAFARAAPDEAAPSEAEVLERIAAIVERAEECGGGVQKSGAVAQYRQAVVAEFLRRAPAGAACGHCRGHPPGLHRHAGTKVFVLPLREAVATRMRLEGRTADVSLSAESSELHLTFDGEQIVPLKSDAEQMVPLKSDGEQIANLKSDGEQIANLKSDGEPNAHLKFDGEHISPLKSVSLMAESTDVKRDSHTDATGGARGLTYLTPLHVREHLRQLWEREGRTLARMLNAPGTHEHGYRVFFAEALAVPPARFRPPSVLNGQRFEHPQNVYLAAAIRLNAQLLALGAGAGAVLGEAVDAWVRLQEQVNYLLDSARAPAPMGKVAPPGVKQVLERKEGLFRKHMMGKRVNYAARSVISPDPNIAVDEIGVPAVFATRLSYPEHVTAWNLAALRDAVRAGPDTHPGALAVELADGTTVRLEGLAPEARAALAARVAPPHGGESGTAQSDYRAPPDALVRVHSVHRHVADGDVVLMNRQPTLHKPSIMAHRVRVLPGEKTLRMHYANCNTYNADFDGDEMNLHMPQAPLARAEAAVVATTHRQYLVPTDGGVLRGLIQDHVVSGVLLCLKDTLLDRGAFMQLLAAGLADVERRGACVSRAGELSFGVGRAQRTAMARVEVPPPAMLRPRTRWTGKQLFTALIRNVLPPGAAERLNLRCAGKIGARYWGTAHADEAAVVVVGGYWATGVADKAQFGASAHGVAHAVYELVGGPAVSALLTAVGRMLTAYDQHAGFTCRLDDLQLTPAADARRREIISAARDAGVDAVLEYAGRPPKGSTDDRKSLSVNDHKRLSEMDDGEGVHRETDALVERIVRDDELARGLDAAMKTHTSRLTSAIIDAVLPAGQLRPFPANNMSLMTLSGAKGSAVNFSQIAGALGQQELEGRRVPVMVSGRTLPSFAPWDARARAGGYIAQRFLTGVRPQEFFFHCMAGREGLIDTAVKTSRSGYLQRCLVKHLEGLSVAYDGTVRDAADASIVQFRYGEDGLDVCKARVLYDHAFFVRNGALAPAAADATVAHETLRAMKKAAKRPERHDPAQSTCTDAVSERFFASAHAFAADSAAPEDTLASLLALYKRAEVDAGEAVGLLAAQSIGEPSTQMTLNTFHFAGFGAKNVTLGIPRLREIVMTASRRIKTPTTTLPLALAGACAEEDARRASELVARKLSRLVLRQVVRHVRVTETLARTADGRRVCTYAVRVELAGSEAAWDAHAAEWAADVVAPIDASFAAVLAAAVSKQLRRINASVRTVIAVQAARAPAPAPDDGDEAAPRQGSGSEDDDSSSDSDDAPSPAADSMGGKDVHRRQLASQEKAESDTDSCATDDMGADAPEDTPEDVAEDTPRAQRRKDEPEGPAAATPAVSTVRWDGDAFEVSVSIPTAAAPRLQMLDIVESPAVLGALVLRATEGIGRVTAGRDERTRALALTAEGSDIGTLLTGAALAISELALHAARAGDAALAAALAAMSPVPSEALTNDIGAVLETLGVEAARATVVREIAAVFAVYGISVDTRHLTLIADYMTRDGGYRPFSRTGMAAAPGSPLLQMTFETTAAFLRSAALAGDVDTLQTPSARLVLGLPVAVGTGSHQVRQIVTN